MTDRYNALVVSLDKDTRDDDAEHIINAIKMIKGVSGVTGNIVDVDTFSAEMRVHRKVAERLYEIINEIYGTTTK